MSGCNGCYTPLLVGGVNASCGGDQQVRAFVLAFMVSLGSAVVSPLRQLQFLSSDAPTFSKTHGWCFVVALTLWTGFGIDIIETDYATREAR